MPVIVRMFAAVREAAGTSETTVEAGPLPDILYQLSSRYGEPFATRLALCSLLIDGSTVARDADHEVPDGAELVLLPPVSGG